MRGKEYQQQTEKMRSLSRPSAQKHSQLLRSQQATKSLSSPMGVKNKKRSQQ